MSDCILSNLKPNIYGYVRMSWRNKLVPAHRLVYALTNKVTLDSIADKVVMHKCDVRNCINPEHLVLGTQQDNMDDKVAKGRCQTTQDRSKYSGTNHPGASLTAEQVAIIRTDKTKTNADLAKLFGVHQKTIRAVLNKTTYKETAID